MEQIIKNIASLIEAILLRRENKYFYKYLFVYFLFCAILAPVERESYSTTKQIPTEWEFPIKK